MLSIFPEDGGPILQRVHLSASRKGVKLKKLLVLLLLFAGTLYAQQTRFVVVVVMMFPGT